MNASMKTFVLTATLLIAASQSAWAEKKVPKANGKSPDSIEQSCKAGGGSSLQTPDSVSCISKSGNLFTFCDVADGKTTGCKQFTNGQRRPPKKWNTAGGSGGGGYGNNGGGQGGNVGGGGNPGGGHPDSAGGVGAGGSPGSVSGGNANSGNGGIN